MIPRATMIPRAGKAARAAASSNGSRRGLLHGPGRLSRTVWCCSIAALIFAAMTSSAHAVTMTNFGGAWGSVDALSGTSVNLNDGFTISPGTAGSLLTGGVVNDLSINAAGYNGVINGASGPVTLGRLSVTSGANTAVFDLLAPQLSQFVFNLPSGPFGVGANDPGRHHAVIHAVAIDYAVTGSFRAAIDAEDAHGLTPGPRVLSRRYRSWNRRSARRRAPQEIPLAAA